MTRNERFELKLFTAAALIQSPDHSCTKSDLLNCTRDKCFFTGESGACNIDKCVQYTWEELQCKDIRAIKYAWAQSVAAKHKERMIDYFI